MDAEGYLEKHELNLISKWDYNNVFGLMMYIKERWNWSSRMFKVKWVKQRCLIELHTGGYSGNEDIIRALLSNNLACTAWYVKWVRGGHYYFEIKPTDVGYRTVAVFSKFMHISKQAIHKAKERYDWLDFGNKVLFIREKIK